MKQFIKLVFSSCLGSILALLVLVIIILSLAFTASSLDDSTIQDQSFILIKFDDDNIVPEMTDDVENSNQIFNIDNDHTVGMNDYKKILKKASYDTKILGVILNLTQANLSLSNVYNIANDLKEFQKISKKPVYCYADDYNLKTYYLASACKKIILNPNGKVDLYGLGTAMLFFENMLKKLEIRPKIYYAGKFKGATEPYRRSNLSSENRQQISQYLNEIESNLIQEFSTNRGLSTQFVGNLIEKGELNNSKNAIQSKIVDYLMYKDDFVEWIKKQSKLDPDENINYISPSNYLKKMIDEFDDDEENKVAVFYMEGSISTDSKDRQSISYTRHQKDLEEILKDETIKAVVLRVNSPGGSAFDSDNIWHIIEKIKKSNKYVVASFGNYAASGGYYISCGADKIVAEPLTLTGSIGVFSMSGVINKLLENKIGITIDTIKTNPNSFLYSNIVESSIQQDSIIQRDVNEIYSQFKTKVSIGRKLTMDKVEDIAQGRIWTGNKGKSIGLVDQIGDIDDAIAIAGKKIKSKYSVVEYPILETDILEKFMDKASGLDLVQSYLLGKHRTKLPKYISDILITIGEVKVVCSQEPQTHLPFRLVETKY